jgi:hypothetical protein
MEECSHRNVETDDAGRAWCVDCFPEGYPIRKENPWSGMTAEGAYWVGKDHGKAEGRREERERCIRILREYGPDCRIHAEREHCPACEVVDLIEEGGGDDNH